MLIKFNISSLAGADTSLFLAGADTSQGVG
jgi:hypothetical protein